MFFLNICIKYTIFYEIIFNTGGVLGSSLHPDSMGKIKALEAKKGLKQQVSVEDVKQPPVFMEPLRDIGVIPEGSNVSVEAKIEPKNDPSLKVEWELNGEPLKTGSRIQTKLDFGHVVLQIDGARASDSGFYTCKAINTLGEAVSTTSVKVEGKKFLVPYKNNSVLGTCKTNQKHTKDLPFLFKAISSQLPTYTTCHLYQMN